MNKHERGQITDVLQGFVVKRYRHDDPEREFYEILIEKWRTAPAKMSEDDFEAFQDFVDEAMQDARTSDAMSSGR